MTPDSNRVLDQSPGWPLRPEYERLLTAVEVLASTIESQVALATRPDPDTDPDVTLIGAFHIARAARCLRAVISLCRAGYAVESASVVRSLLEDAASLRYLSVRPDSRVRKWLRFDETRSLEYWRLSERLGLGLTKSARIEQLESTGVSGNPVWWSGKTPSAMARDVREHDEDLSRTFRTLYPWLSDVAHANIKTTVNYYFCGADGTPMLRVGPSDHRVDLLSDISATLAVKVCEIANDLGARTDMEALRRAKAVVDGLAPHSARDQG